MRTECLFWLAPIVIFIPTIVVFAVIPFGEQMVLADLNVGVLVPDRDWFDQHDRGVHGGWSSNNKYALLGAMRTIAMLISYELIQVLVLLAAVLFVGSMRLGDIVAWQAGLRRLADLPAAAGAAWSTSSRARWR